MHGEALDAGGDVTQDHLAGGDHTDGGTLPVGQIDHVVSAGREATVRTATHDARLPVRQDRRTPAPAHPRRRHRHRRAHRPPPHGLVPVQRRAHQPLPRDRRLELPRQRVRRSRPTVRSASDRGGRATGRCSSRARRSCTTSPASRSSGCATSRSSSGPTAACGTTPRIRSCPGDPERTHDFLQGSAGWGDAIVIVPWELHRVYRDDGVLAELWPAMVRWVEYAAPAAALEPCPGARRQLGPIPHRTRRTCGTRDSTGASGSSPAVASGSADQGHVATAFLHHSASLVARIGRLLGHDREAERFEDPRDARRGCVANRIRRRRRIARRRTRRPTTCARWRSGWSTGRLARSDRGPPRRADPTGRAPTSAPASSPRRTCCPCSPTPDTSTSPTNCSSRTLPPRGWRWWCAAPPPCGRTGTASARTEHRRRRSTTTARAR